MRTRAQASRDAALRRLTRVNHGLTAAAAIGAGVLTDVVAHTASAHTRTLTSTVGTQAAAGSGSVAQPGAVAEGDDRLTTSSAPAAVTKHHGSAAPEVATTDRAPARHSSSTAAHRTSTAAPRTSAAAPRTSAAAAPQQQSPAPAVQQQAPAPSQPAPVVVSGGS